LSSKPVNRPRLGRGLNALLSLTDEPEAVPSVGTRTPPTSGPVMAEVNVADDAPATSDRTTLVSTPATPWRMVELAAISVNPHQPRKQMNEAGLADLAASLKSNGVIQPIVVRELEGSYQLIAGERRYRAATLAGLTEIPAIVRSVDAYTQAQLALVENIHREDLNPIERAAAYQSLMTQLGLTQAELAARLGEQRSSVANYLRLMDLAEPVRVLVRDGLLSLGHAKVLAGVADANEQVRLANLCVAQGLSVRNLERLIETPTPVAQAPEQASAYSKELEAAISRQLGLRVQVRSTKGKGKGRVVIHYNSLDQFDELVKRMGVELEAM
jgi:ParB family transcriptional regulator, chromosome partitioning protein